MEAAGVEPASLEPSVPNFYKLSQYCSSCFATDSYTRGWRHFIYTRLLTFPSFFARYRRPSSLTSIQSRAERLRPLRRLLQPNRTERESRQLRQPKEPCQHYCWHLGFFDSFLKRPTIVLCLLFGVRP